MRVGVIAFEKKTAGHCRTEVAERVLQRIVKLDYALLGIVCSGCPHKCFICKDFDSLSTLGILGGECSNHSVPTIFCKGIKGLRSWFPFSFLPCAKLAQNARKTIR